MRRKRGVTPEQLRAWLDALPEFEERETWGHPTFRVRGRMFGGMDAEGSTVTLKATLEEQRALVAEDPSTFAVPPYVGKHGWVRVQLALVDPEELHEIAVEAWCQTAPKRVVAAWERDQAES